MQSIEMETKITSKSLFKINKPLPTYLVQFQIFFFSSSSLSRVTPNVHHPSFFVFFNAQYNSVVLFQQSKQLHNLFMASTPGHTEKQVTFEWPKTRFGAKFIFYQNIVPLSSDVYDRRSRRSFPESEPLTGKNGVRERKGVIYS